MKKEDIQLNDWTRVFVGEVPPEFFIELLIRIIIIYLILMISMRLMGKRMASMLSRTELVAVVSLSAAIGIPMQAADRGILPGIVVAITVVCMQRLLAALAFKNQWFETLFQDKEGVLVQDHVMQTDRMRRIGISKERLFAQLRSEGIKQLGEVKRLYQEANGSFCLITESSVQAGLSVLPEEDAEMRNEQKPASFYVCSGCGAQKLTENQICTCSRNPIWIPAVQ